MKSLLVFHPALAPYRVDFFNALSLDYITKFYFNFTNVQDQSFDQQNIKKQIKFNPSYLNKGFEFMSRSIRLGVISIIQKEKPNIVICSEFSQITIITYVYYVLTKKKFRLFTMCDDSLENSKERYGIRFFLRNFISRRIDGVIYCSDEVASWNKCHISSKINSLEMPIIHDDKIFRNKLAQSLQKSSEYIENYKLKDKKIILFVGRLVSVKNIPVLLDAFAQVYSENCILVIVGSGPLDTLLHKIVLNRNLKMNVIFTDRLEGNELYAWFNLAQIFVLPSTYERFGAVVNEALLAGCYVMCSNKAGAATLIDENNGVVFKPEDVNDLALKLKKQISLTDSIVDNVPTLRKSRMRFTFQEKFDFLVKSL